MRAKSVNFERGQDPKETMGIGNENLAIFNKALREKNYFSPVMEQVINGLEEGSIPINSIEKFIHGAVEKYNSARSISWYEWFNESSNIFWDKSREELVITFEMPETGTWDITNYRKIYCKIGESSSTSWGEKTYKINSFLEVTQLPGAIIEEVFHRKRYYYSNDELFKINQATSLISSVVQDAIINMG